MPNNEYTPNPVAGSGVKENETSVSINDTAFLHVGGVDTALLRGLFCYPAPPIAETAGDLEPEDCRRSLNAAATGSVDLLASTSNYVACLEAAWRRAGLEVSW